jgi:hypothetical protein
VVASQVEPPEVTVDRKSKGQRAAVLCFVVLLLGGLTPALAVWSSGCADLTTSPTGSSTPVTSADTSETETPSTAGSTDTTVAGSRLSQESLDYAESLGGTSHKGEKLYFVIGASVKTESQALALLEPAKAVGDMQSYFIVQLSDNFDGMTPGYWVVFEAYRDYPSAENIDFGRRPFPDAYVKSAVVLTDDPIPVYEDMMGD